MCTGWFVSCIGDLDQFPKVEITSESVYTSVDNYKSVMAKVYASLTVAGNEKGDGNSDLSSDPSNGAGYMRQYFNLQELPTDEAIYTWGGGDKLDDIQYMRWGASDTWVSGMYYRMYYTIALCNEFLRNATDDKLAEFPEADRQTILSFCHDVRFIRALVYSHVMDLYGHGPFVSEADPVGAFFPANIERKNLFEYIETELKAVELLLPEPRSNEYGRVSRAAAWALLAKNYLNAAVYTGTERNTDCITYCNKVIGAGYALESDYAKLFNADNDRRTNEIIFPLAVDVEHTTTYGTTTYLVCGSIMSSNAAVYGVESQWQSFRALSDFVALFNSADKRGRFVGENADIDNPTDYTQGYAIIKFTNLNDDGTYKADGDLVSTDFPVIRLADVYLMYAEAVVRGGTGGSTTEAVNYINRIRERAYGDTSGNIGASELTLDFLLAERGRELFWECTRRTDLIRFGRFTGNTYIWQWKGGVKQGTATDAKYNLFPIPVTDIAANPNLSNENY
jgi:hypothetical protein